MQLVFLFIFVHQLEGHHSPFSYLEPAPVRATVALSSQALCQSQECRETPAIAYCLLGD